MLYFLLNFLKIFLKETNNLKKKFYLCALFLKSISGTCLKSVIFRRLLLSTDPGLLIATFPSLQPTLGPHNPNWLWSGQSILLLLVLNSVGFVHRQTSWVHLNSEIKGRFGQQPRTEGWVFPPIPGLVPVRVLLNSYSTA